MSLSSNITRRGALGLVAGAAVIVAAGPSAALDAAQAERFVAAAITDLRRLVEAKASPSQFLSLLEEKGAVPQVGKFAMARSWREMSSGQQDAYQAAFRG